MKKIITTVALLVLSITMASANKIEEPLTKLEGIWYVNMSNFKMWLNGNKHNPTFTYTLETKKKVLGLKDVVSYSKNKKEKYIKGFDKPLDVEAKTFEWRGNGFLCLFKSKWEILFQNESFTIIHFQKTVFTSEGYDVISKQKNLDTVTINLIHTKLLQLGLNTPLQVISQQ